MDLFVLVFRYNKYFKLHDEHNVIKYVDINNIEEIKNYLLDNDLSNFSDSYIVINRKNICFVKCIYNNFNDHYILDDEGSEELFDMLIQIISMNDIRDEGDYIYHMEKDIDHNLCEV